MSQTNDVEGVKEKKVMNDGEKIQVDDGKDQIFGEEVAVSEELKNSDENEKNLMPSATEEVRKWKFVIYGSEFFMFIYVYIYIYFNSELLILLF